MESRRLLAGTTLEANDAFEPNDTAATAIHLPSGGIPREFRFVDATVGINNDVDFVSFDVDGPSNIIVDIDARDGNRSDLDSIVELYRVGSNQILASNDDAADPGSGHNQGDSYLEHQVGSEGRYAVKVQGKNNTVGNYRINIGIRPAVPFGAYEFNDSFDTAAPLNLVANVPLDVTGVQIRPTGDVDFFSVNLPSAGQLRLDVDTQEIGLSTLDAKITLFDSAGTNIASNDDGTDPQTGYRGLDPALTRFLDAGTYVIKVDGTTSQLENFYRFDLLYVPAISLAGDDIGDTMPSSQSVVTDSFGLFSRFSAINDINDVDLFRIDLSDILAPTTIFADIDAEENGSALDSVLRVFDQRGVELSRNDDSRDRQSQRDGTDSTIQHLVALPGIYYVGVSSFGNADYSASQSDGSGGQTAGEYVLNVAVMSPQPLPAGSSETPKQIVWLNFEGGDFTGVFGIRFNISPFRASDVGRPDSERASLIDQIFAEVREDFITGGSFESPGTPLNLPIRLTMEQPNDGSEYSTLFIGGQHPTFPSLGMAKVDFGNRTIQDNGAAFTKEIGREPTVIGSDANAAALAVASTVSHEIGHLLGLSHQVEDGLLLQSGALDDNRVDNERFGRGQLYSAGAPNHAGPIEDSVALLRQNLSRRSDGARPNNTLGTADPSFTGIGQVSNFIYRLDETNDIDLVRFDALAGETITLDIDAISINSSVDLSLRILDDAGNELAKSQDAVDPASGLPSFDPFLRFRIPTDGSYLAEVTGQSLSYALPQSLVSDYQLSLSRTDDVIESRFPTVVSRSVSTKGLNITSSTSHRVVDSEGVEVTVNLTGPGRVEIDTSTGNAGTGDIRRLVVHDATAATQLSVTGASGSTRIGEVYLTNDAAADFVFGNDQFLVHVGQFQAVGRVGNLSISGRLAPDHGTGVLGTGGNTGSLSVGELPDGSLVRINGQLGQLVVQGSSAAPIHVRERLSLASFGSDLNGLISARSIGQVNVTGDVRTAIDSESDHELQELAFQPGIEADGSIDRVLVEGSYIGSLVSGGNVERVDTTGEQRLTLRATQMGELAFRQGSTLLSVQASTRVEVELQKSGTSSDRAFALRDDLGIEFRITDPTGNVLRNGTGTTGVSFDGLAPQTYWVEISSPAATQYAVAIELSGSSQTLQTHPRDIAIAVADSTSGETTIVPSDRLTAVLFEVSAATELSAIYSGLGDPNSLVVVDATLALIGQRSLFALEATLNAGVFAVLVPPSASNSTLAFSFSQPNSFKQPTTNIVQPQDANADGSVSPVDALFIINTIRRLRNSGSLNPPSRFLTDVDANGDISPADALSVINFLRRNRTPASVAGEEYQEDIFTLPMTNTSTATPQFNGTIATPLKAAIIERLDPPTIYVRRRPQSNLHDDQSTESPILNRVDTIDEVHANEAIGDWTTLSFDQRLAFANDITVISARP